MKLDDLTAWLYGRTAGGIKWGLDTTRTLLAGGGDPHRRFRSLHVGGTNGKGSVAAMCAAVLQARGRGRIGLYTSPHLVSFGERIRVDGAPVGEDRIIDAARRLEPFIEETSASFFEATTAIALLCFADAGVDFAVVEVGLGGRLDATNVITPLATVITNVALDHTLELGDTLELVAGEKAGILKAGVPAITAETDPGALKVLRAHATETGCDLRHLDDDASIEVVETGLAGTRFRLRSRNWGDGELQVPLIGEHQARNAALAAEALALLPADERPDREALRRGLAAVRWPGRLQVEEIRGTTWIFDVAHNPAGAAALAGALDRLPLPRPLVLIAGILADKRWDEMLPPLLQRVDATVLTVPPTAPDSRRWNPVEAAERIGSAGPVRVVPDLADALSRASTLAPHGTVLVTGSVHTVGDALHLLGLDATI